MVDHRAMGSAIAGNFYCRQHFTLWKDDKNPHPSGLKIEYGKQFRVQALISQPGKGVVDDLKEKDEEEGATFVLENPKFPLCYPQTTPRPGETVPVKLEYLKPNSPIHGLIGPNLVFQGKTDSIGGGTINLPIPKETREGQHLVTVGVDGTAFTADCVVEVKK